MGSPTYPFTVSHRNIWAIALPASLAFITEPLVGIVDIAIIGRLGDAGLLGGLELGAVAFDLLFAMAFFLRLGTAGLTAQAVGARSLDGGLVHLLRAGFLGLVIGLILVALINPIQAMGTVLFAPPSEGVMEAFSTYLQVRIFSAPFVLMNFAFLGWFYGRGAAKIGMVLQIGVNLLNIAFSIWFVYGLGWGVAGAAAGTVIAEVIVAVVSIFVVIWQFGGLAKINSSVSISHLLDPIALWRLFDLSRDLMIRSLAVASAFAFLSSQMSRAGEIALASSAVLLNFSMITAFFLDGQAQAAEFFCGKAVGANYRPAFEQGLRLSMIGGLVIGFGLFLVWMLLGPPLIDLLTTNVEVRSAARTYLFVAAFIAFTGVVSFVLDGAMAGATMNVIMRNGMLASLAIFVGAALLLQSWLGLSGLWLALHVFFISRGVIFWFAVRAKTPSLFSPT